MSAVLPGAGSGPKITTKFKAKVFSFADVVVRGNKLTLYQISEPLEPSSSASASNPAPFGTDVNGTPLNDPIPDTLVDPTTGNVVSAPAAGQPALLDRFTVAKPEVEDGVSVHIDGPQQAVAGSTITYSVRVRNGSAYALNGAQVVIHLPDGEAFAGATSDALRVYGAQVVGTVGRIGVGGVETVEVSATLCRSLSARTMLHASAVLRSSTALPVSSNVAPTLIVR